EGVDARSRDCFFLGGGQRLCLERSDESFVILQECLRVLFLDPKYGPMAAPKQHQNILPVAIKYVMRKHAAVMRARNETPNTVTDTARIVSIILFLFRAQRAAMRALVPQAFGVWC